MPKCVCGRALPDPVGGFKGPTYKEREGREGEEREGGGKVKGRGRREKGRKGEGDNKGHSRTYISPLRALLSS